MTSRIQQALDGDLPVDQLTTDELQAYHRLSAVCAAALEPLAATPAIDVSAAEEGLERVAGDREVR